MADVKLSDRGPRLALSWTLFLVVCGLVATAAETRLTVSLHSKDIAEIRETAQKAAENAATSKDIVRLEERIIRIESLLLQQQNRTGR